jgi:hypothetical protein
MVKLINLWQHFFAGVSHEKFTNIPLGIDRLIAVYCLTSWSPFRGR